MVYNLYMVNIYIYLVILRRMCADERDQEDKGSDCR